MPQNQLKPEKELEGSIASPNIYKKKKQNDMLCIEGVLRFLTAQTHLQSGNSFCSEIKFRIHGPGCSDQSACGSSLV